MQKETSQLKIELSPTQDSFVFSDAIVNLLYSSKGEGKTYANIVAMMQHAKRCGKNIRCAIVRDTHENIKTSTARSIMDALPLDLYRFKNDYKHLVINSSPKVEVDLFGIDDAAALSKLMGPEYALIWLEEPAPIAEAVNAGLSEDVFNAALAACARQKNTIPRLQISMNPGEENHWTYKRFFLDTELSQDGLHLVDSNYPLITFRIFRIPKGENDNLSDFARQATAVAYGKDSSGSERFVEGQFAKIYKGSKVTPDYNKNGQHLSLDRLIPARGLVGFRGWDGWFNPSAVIGQITNTGRLVFLDTCRLEGGDVRTLIENQVKPLLESPRWKDKCSAWRDCGDTSMQTPDQSNIQMSASRVIEEAFETQFEGGPPKWTHMKRGIIRALNHSINGMPAIVINPNNRILHSALAGGWYYKTDNSGNVVNDIPVKNEDSHVGDAWVNAVNVLLSTGTMNKKKLREMWAKMNSITKKRAASYSVGIAHA